MSLNILTAVGLQEVGKVTKEKVVSALGYEPANKEDLPNIQDDSSGELYIADENGNVIARVDANGIHTTEVEANGIMLGQGLSEHIANSGVHVTSKEKEAWNSKSDFSGIYQDLINAPNIAEDNAGSMIVADNEGYVIMRVDSDGVTTTNVNAKTIQLNGEDLGSRLDSLESSIPNIVDDESGEFVIADESGKVIVKIDAAGLETTVVSADRVVVDGVEVKAKLDEIALDVESLGGHVSNGVIHITAEERELWSNKSDFSGDYKDLSNAPDIIEDESGEVCYADSDGNIIAKIGESGFETTQVVAGTVIVGGSNIGSHIGNEDIHITAQEKKVWDEKASTDYVDQKLADLVNLAPDKLNTLDELAAALGDDENFASNVIDSLSKKAGKSDFDDHTASKTVHITAEERAAWNNKSNFSGDYNDLTNKINILDDESDEFNIADKDGFVVFKIDGNGVHSTSIVADTLILNGEDIGTKIDSINTGDTSNFVMISDIVDNLETENAFKALSANQGVILRSQIEASTTTDSAITVQLGANGNVGGYKTGDVIEAGTSIQTILNKLLQKAVAATYTKPTLSLSNNGGTASGNIEAGSSVTPKLRASFTKNDSGGLTSIKIMQGSTAVASGTATPLDYSGPSIVIGDNTVTFTASADYSDAPVKNNNLGEESKENWFAGSTVTSSSYSITGKRQLFYGTGTGALPTITSDIVRGLSGKKLAPANGNSFNVNVAIGQQYIVIAYPKSLRDINNITYVEANDSGMAANFTKTEMQVADARGGTNGLADYKVYTYAMAVPAAAAMTFKVTI